MTHDETNRFDDALRGRHRAALEQLSPRVRAQLAQRRRVALLGAAAYQSERRPRLGYAAAGFAALCALALGVQFHNPPAQTRPPAVTLAATSPIPARADNTMLDQDPDFYAWLASSDAMQVAME